MPNRPAAAKRNGNRHASGDAESLLTESTREINRRESERRNRRDDAQRNRELTAIVDAQAAQIEQLRGRRYKIQPGKPKRKAGKSFCRVIVPDSHGCLIDRPAMAAFLSDLEQIQPAEIVMLGDHLECGGFLAEHHTLGYVAQAEYTFQQDCDAANEFLDCIQSRCPGASIDYIEGNHERRIETWIITRTLRSRADGEYLRSLFSTDVVLNLQRRGINWIRQGVFYDGLSIPGAIKRGHCHFTHGTSTATHAAAKTLSRFGANVVFGHTHRADSFVQRTVKAGTIAAWNPGCLSVLQPLWQHGNPTDWSHGYGLQIVVGDDFLHINVPIVDGTSLLHPLAMGIGKRVA